MLQIALVQFLSNGIVKTKLVILTLLYWGEFAKNPSAQLRGVTRLLSSVRFKNDKFSVDIISNDLIGQTLLLLYEYTPHPAGRTSDFDGLMVIYETFKRALERKF